ncbi:NFACT family protein [Gloeocapsa sp. PCC 73106]|uniref:Rqc2 family fibronectin-binding protein n=1 Tax=Gloeocapsa sp. PCC 73106 TaxID=102232 RepID=UPI0002AC9B98|nr:NFACT RNA binding domain-containing protein [Gloeocapsa sp. PCC 73106]ELR97797.1 putative RNA-binding protein, snRNP like protein [Gloeocapsa sp. PCC 73106]
MQPVDYTTMIAACSQLEKDWLPGRVEQVYQRDRYTVSLGLRTFKQKGWLDLAWHPQGARICLGSDPPRTPDTFTFSDQLRHQLKGFALIKIEPVTPWERVLDLQFAKRPGEEASWHLYLEIMGKYSNLVLTNTQQQIITVAHQVSSTQSSLRPLQTGQSYELPPPLTTQIPSLTEDYTTWQHRLSLIPRAIAPGLLKTYRGLSPTLVRLLLRRAGLDSEKSVDSLSSSDWQQLFTVWQEWLYILSDQEFVPVWTDDGYNVLGWNGWTTSKNVSELLNSYYTEQLSQQVFQQLRQQLEQKIKHSLSKLRTKRDTFAAKLQESQEAEQYRQKADLLMAHLHQWEPGMSRITLADFETLQPVSIKLNPEKNAVQNAQTLYKKHQKLKRARDAVIPLWQATLAEIHYLEQIEVNLAQLELYTQADDLLALEEIKAELIQQNYLPSLHQHVSNNKVTSEPHRYSTPSGFQLWIGRNNRQNEQLTFRTAGDYDLWFHTQEIPGSHVLLRLEPGSVPYEQDLQFSADLTAYYSQARESDRVPVIYTEPKYVYKPKGAQPGIAIYKKERVIWGRPQVAKAYLEANSQE